jgi:GNAT superfamily N-acetyltransferase
MLKYIQSTGLDYGRLQEVVDLDALVYPPELRGTLESISERYKANMEMFIYAVDGDNKLAGYICFFPISHRLYNAMLGSDTMFDDNIEPEDVLPYTQDDDNNIFLISVVVNPRYAGQGVGTRLMQEMMSYLDAKQQRGCRINCVMAVTASKGGEKLLDNFGFYPLRKYDNRCTLVQAKLPLTMRP